MSPITMRMWCSNQPIFAVNKPHSIVLRRLHNLTPLLQITSNHNAQLLPSAHTYNSTASFKKLQLERLLPNTYLSILKVDNKKVLFFPNDLMCGSSFDIFGASCLVLTGHASSDETELVWR
ncbi:predicted protein [Sclerotinia sclerotiorum 1980 UF-70]|uniref:Uncharacterized protein n=1 Tax=Sclerotinia sclerotiorum (strain ATCC 18683 / 1980 / Ss-1) TaxID=665079 RepID=A7F1S5_SCLS1|nr:predicted protein [Sclerotinia sclerotiorum 1980 UF-70]EDN95667.1 predicted protein [Sclerotinia sclerotiorum 1980 UF-70]